MVDLTKKDEAEALSAKIDGHVATFERNKKLTRTNWDTPENSALRERLANSWENRNDLFTEGESFGRFCIRNAIDRNVLLRFMQRRKAKMPPQKRGRPTLLSLNVMEHLCERKFIVLCSMWHARYLCCQIISNILIVNHAQ